MINGMELLKRDKAAFIAANALHDAGATVHIVGGAVRDALLGKSPKDVDLVVGDLPFDQIMAALKSLPGKVTVTGNDFPVPRYRTRDGAEVEVAIRRIERGNGSGRTRDFEVNSDPMLPIEDDLGRRDFTINAMALDPFTNELVDPFGGVEDINNRRLRTVSPRSFQDDATRILRGLTAVSKHGMHPDEATLAQARDWKHRFGTTHEERDEKTGEIRTVRDVPYERIQTELDKIMSGQNPAKAMRFAQELGLFDYFMPEVAATHKFDQRNKYHNQELFDHLMGVLEHMSTLSGDPDKRMAAMLHDIGKPASQWFDSEGGAHYYFDPETRQGQDHEDVGAEMAHKILTELKYPTNRVNRISHMIKHHMFPGFNTSKGARKFIARVGQEHAHDLIDLREADQFNHSSPSDGNADIMRQLVDTAQEEKAPTGVSSLAINGKDLIDLGVKPGPGMGKILNDLAEAVIDDPALNTRETLLQMAQQRVSNVLDEVQTTLDPNVFTSAGSNNPHVKPEIRSWVEKKVRSILKKNGYKNSIIDIDIVMTGSLTTFQWSEKSDFDVSLFLEWEKMPEVIRADIIEIMISNLDGVKVPKTTHELQVYVVSPDVTKEDLYREDLRSAYDLVKGEWIVPPNRNRSMNVVDTMPKTVQYAKDQADKMELMLKYSPYGAKEFWKQIHERRRRDQAAGKGDYAESNIIYKMLENKGLKPKQSATLGGRGYDWEIDQDMVRQVQTAFGLKNLEFLKVRNPVSIAGKRPKNWDDHWYELGKEGLATYQHLNDNHIIDFHPLMGHRRANNALWEEIAHAIQQKEGRLQPYDPSMTDSEYDEDPNEKEAKEFAQKWSQYPIVRRTKPIEHPHTYFDPVTTAWVGNHPDEYHKMIRQWRVNNPWVL